MARRTPLPFTPPLLAEGFPLEGCTVKSARRTLEIFEYFSERQQPASVLDIAGDLGYPPSSTSVLLRSLLALGYLEYDRQSRLYVPSIRISLLGGWVHDDIFRDGNLLSLTHELRRKTGQSIILGLQNGIFAHYILHLDSQAPLRPHARTGSLRPICRAAIGRALLTTKDDAEIAGILRRSNARESEPANRLTPASLLAEIALCRRRGYAYTEGTVTPGRGVIARLLPTADGHMPMAIGVGAPIAYLRANKTKIVKLLREKL